VLGCSQGIAAGLRNEETNMHRNLPLLAGLALVTVALTPMSASAAPAATYSPLISVTSRVQTVQYWGDRYRDRGWRYDGYHDRCRVWRHRCAEHWGWGGWEFRRCLWRHGCGERRY
jgi:hypothetical protein